jgi:hypothetical protein
VCYLKPKEILDVCGYIIDKCGYIIDSVLGAL